MASTIKPHFRALQIIHLNQPVTPQEINEHVGLAYASKYISVLQTYHGFEFTVQKDGRKVVSYTCVKEPDNVAELRAAPEPEKPKKPKVDAAKIKSIRARAPKAVNAFSLDSAPQQDYYSTFTIDREWDSFDGNLRDIL